MNAGAYSPLSAPVRIDCFDAIPVLNKDGDRELRRVASGKFITIVDNGVSAFPTCNRTDDSTPNPYRNVLKSAAMKRKKSVGQVQAAYLCRFQPEPEGGFTVTCPKLPPIVTYGETLEEAQANAREAIELCLEVMRADGHSAPPPDGDLTSPIEQLVAVGAPAV